MLTRKSTSGTAPYRDRRGKFKTARYIRMSDKRQDKSPERQLRDVETIRQIEPQLVFSDELVYSDHGVSGWKENRSDFQRLVADAKTGLFNVVAIDDVDRFTRMNPKIAMRYLLELDAHGIGVIDAATGWVSLDDPAGFITTYLKTDRSHNESADKAYRRATSMARDTAEGIWRWPRPYGYLIENRRLVFGPAEEVEMVRLIFAEFLRGVSREAIARMLNRKGIKTIRGNRWNPETITYMLKNETYAGTYVSGNQCRSQFVTSIPSQYIPDNHPAIIERETFDLVQSKLGTRKQHSRSTEHNRFVLTGLLRCGLCGGIMTGRIGKDDVIRYRCRYHLKNNCPGVLAKQNEILDATVRTISDYFQQEKTLDAIRKAMIKRLTPSARSGRSESAIRKAIKQCESNLDRAHRNLALADPEFLNGIQQQIRELKAEKVQLQSELKSAARPEREIKSEVDATVSAVCRAYARIEEHLAKGRLVLDQAKV